MRLRLNSISKSSSEKHFLSVLFAPVNIPWKRRLETLAVMHFIFIWIIWPVMCFWVPFYVLSTKWWFIVPLYGVWFYIDRHTPRRGSRPWKWYKNNIIWKHFADYFPLRLVKTAELSPERNYIIGSHPHGMLSIGVFTSMATNATGFHEKFPGMEPTIMTLNGQFYFPLRREVGTALGGIESSRESLEYALENPGKGKAVAIVLGGATEALDAHPGKHILTLKSRRGFCRYALKFGADLVPMYNFGENDVYEQCENPHGSRLRILQEKIRKVWGICPPLLRGRSIFSQYMIGLMPFRKPITSVMGKPIRVTKVDDPTDEQIDSLHEKYCEALYDLFEEYKHLHSIDPDVHLTIQ